MTTIATGDDIFTLAPEEMRKNILAVLDNLRSQLIAGNLRAVILIGVSKFPNVNIDGIICGTPEATVWQLQRAISSIVNTDLAQSEARAKALTQMIIGPHAGEA